MNLPKNERVDDETMLVLLRFLKKIDVDIKGLDLQLQIQGMLRAVKDNFGSPDRLIISKDAFEAYQTTFGRAVK